VIREERKRELEGYIADALADGCRAVTDGRGAGPSQGYFLGATILDGVKPGMRVLRDELFGPVLSVLRAADIDEALAQANASHYGNMASIFTTSGRSAREFQRRIEAGMLGINVGVAAPMAFLPFTGWKGSFFGDLHATGADSVRFYTRPKVVTARWF
jgi:malonate-semialdehyde dehydrogenase (acetylating)/methylmalonate-semialdehyde dehydrogenase